MIRWWWSSRNLDQDFENLFARLEEIRRKVDNMATLDDLRGLEDNEKAALAQLAQTMQTKLDALQQKIDQGAQPQDFTQDVQALQSHIDEINQIAQEQGRSATPPPPPPNTSRQP